MLDHCEEAKQNSFCQFIYVGATLTNKEKYQSFPIQFADNKFRHDSAIALSIKMLSSHKTDKAAELAEELCDECFDLNFTNVFCSSAQDLASSAV